MTFVDLMEAEHYDIVIGDEAWDVDYYYHENPELKRQPFVFLTDFVGCLPMEDGNEREALLCADRNADDIEHVARYPYLRDARDLRRQPRGRDRAALRPRPAAASATGPTATSATAATACRSIRRRWPTPSACARGTATAATRRSRSPPSAARPSARHLLQRIARGVPAHEARSCPSCA